LIDALNAPSSGPPLKARWIAAFQFSLDISLQTSYADFCFIKRGLDNAKGP
jgi:hypothetical protein